MIDPETITISKLRRRVRIVALIALILAASFIAALVFLYWYVVLLVKLMT